MLNIVTTIREVETDLREGEWQCPICGTWSADGCVHMNADATDLLSGVDLTEIEVAA